MPTDPFWLPSLSYDETELRKVDSMLVMPDGTALGSRAGVRPGDPGLAVTLAGSVINVSTGVAALYRSGQGVYRAYLAATSPGSVAAANATFSRIDLVYLRVWDTAVDSSGLRKADAVYLQGTASASPVAPTPGATEIYIPLATINVPVSGGGSPTVSQAIRPYTVAPGGILPTTSNAEPSSGGPGTVFYDSDTDVFWYFKADGTTKQKILASSGASVIGQLTEARMASDQPATSTTTLTNVTGMSLAVAANATYLIEAYLSYTGEIPTSPGPGDLRLDWTIPSGATMKWARHGMPSNGINQLDAVETDHTTIRLLGTYGASTNVTARPVGWITTATLTAGILQLRMAQGTSNATSTILRAGSWLRLTRYA
ncbi:hypothetical protein [Kitasatospora sp. NPDC059571]|uniref:hypothetical protein n=1 Tax=Kitasatospora sp. NPDC059571 TaxID=3346871 RepID=UPI00367DBC41